MNRQDITCSFRRLRSGSRLLFFSCADIKADLKFHFPPCITDVTVSFHVDPS